MINYINYFQFSELIRALVAGIILLYRSFHSMHICMYIDIQRPCPRNTHNISETVLGAKW